MSAVNLAKQEWTKANFDDFIVPKYINSPFTTIQNRSQVLDSSNMIQAVMGVERIPVRGINLLPKEFGANGEQVWEIESKDSRIRLVGSGWTSGGFGAGIFYTATVNDYIEISFYGTGLNLMAHINNDARDARVTIDNQTESATNILIGSTVSPILNGRLYVPNVILNAASGLTLGQHTVKIRCQSTYLTISGFEILNQSTSLTIPSGQAFIGNKKESLAVLSTSAYNAGVVGTKGARVVKYLKDGVISQVVTEVPASPTYFPTVIDHANEEVVRRVNFREFGANRGDDLSTLSTESTRSFTLDDGTTTLVASAMRATVTNGYDAIHTGGGGDHWVTITFVGTGLDIFMQHVANAAADSLQRFNVDGTGDVSLGAYVNSIRTMKICSGLPYGTHTVKFIGMNGRIADFFIMDFIIYQPKKPTIPAGAIEVADYNVMANFIPASSGAIGFIGQGVLRKFATREHIYVNTHTIGGSPAETDGMTSVNTNNAGSYNEYTFFGTGVQAHGNCFATQPYNGTWTINGLPLTGLTVSLLQASTGLSITSAGVMTGTPSGAGQYRLQISGLPLGRHTIRRTHGAGPESSVYHGHYDVITPIHINHPTLKIGSLGLLDNAKIGAIKASVNSAPDLSKAKAWINFDASGAKIVSSYNVSQALVTSNGFFSIYFAKAFKNANYVCVYGTNINQFLSENSAIPRTRNLISLKVNDYNGSVASQSINCVVFFGELEDE